MIGIGVDVGGGVPEVARGVRGGEQRDRRKVNPLLHELEDDEEDDDVDRDEYLRYGPLRVAQLDPEVALQCAGKLPGPAR
eukprot:CAMPEP_0182859696 /NCGR_PEP_ID=MMETSP0034_2-20130328/4467_1 /TAXON_ID=156128 /ORGANISM="Nephroselmis pyriformis, Strain CCMP717" /LENGTH=79 /DNA_ID=CAMNT_0024991369 /DNA_START=333 /DNA_END=569 /DNA_ORIENTATION=-